MRFRGEAREWTAASGKYTLEAELMAFDDADVVLQKEDKSLVGVDLDQLSAEDQEYVRSEEAAAAVKKRSENQQTWEMRNGLKVLGRVVDFMQRDVTFRMFRGKIYVNDHEFKNLPPVYQKIAPLVAAYFTERDITDEAGLRDWLKRRKGAPETFNTEGVLLELPDGNHYAVPFFLFGEKALKALQPGWDRWVKAANNYADQQESALYLESQAQAYQENSESMQDLLKLQIGMQAVNAGVTNVWEVVLYPQRGTGGPALSVVVPGLNSRDAQMNALNRNPGYNLGPVRKVNTRF